MDATSSKDPSIEPTLKYWDEASKSAYCKELSACIAETLKPENRWNFLDPEWSRREQMLWDEFFELFFPGYKERKRERDARIAKEAKA